MRAKWLLRFLILVAVTKVLSSQEFVSNVPPHRFPGRISVSGDDVWFSDGTKLWHADMRNLTWSSSVLPYHEIDMQLHFIGSAEGWILIGSHLLHTMDGGLAWTETALPLEFAVEGFALAPNKRVWAFGAQRGRMLSKNEVARSSKYTTLDLANGTTVELNPAFNIYSGGSSTNLVATQLRGPAKAIYFGHNLILFADPWQINWSDDGGSSWHASSCLSTFNPDCQDETPVTLAGFEPELWCGTADGSIQLSSDQGRKWNTLGYVDTNRHSVIESLQFLTRYRGFALTGGRIFRTDDGGHSWNATGLSSVEDMTTDDQRIFILTKNRLYELR